MKRNEIPIGFSMALMENPEAMEKFALMSEEKKHAITEGARSVRSKSEMHSYVIQILHNS